MSLRHLSGVVLAGLFGGTAAARADITLLLEEPYGEFGGMNPTGHAASLSLANLRRARLSPCAAAGRGEDGVVLSRYHRIAGYDWIAIPVIPYLYAVDRAEQVPLRSWRKGRRIVTRRLPPETS